LHAYLILFRVLKYQFLTETYTTETVPALRKIRGYLELAHQDAVEELEVTRQKLQEYAFHSLWKINFVDMRVLAWALISW
jgi:hypothetical protein